MGVMQPSHVPVHYRYQDFQPVGINNPHLVELNEHSFHTGGRIFNFPQKSLMVNSRNNPLGQGHNYYNKFAHKIPNDLHFGQILPGNTSRFVPQPVLSTYHTPQK